jgi:hypothetical protein
LLFWCGFGVSLQPALFFLLEVFVYDALAEDGEEAAEEVEDEQGGEGAEDEGDEGVFDEQSDNEAAGEGEQSEGGAADLDVRRQVRSPVLFFCGRWCGLGNWVSI